MIPIAKSGNLPSQRLTATMSPDPILEVKSKAITKPSANRIMALDFTKGALVLVMVLYHWLNYFHGSGGSVYRYLRFLPPSFIFITGFLISNAYLSRYGIADARLPKKLVLRGLKILGLFVILNLAISFLFGGFRNLNPGNLLAVYWTGNVSVAGAGKAAAFYVLVPISYLLLLSAALLLVCRFYKHSFYLVCALFWLSIFILSVKGLESANLELVAIGLLGIIVGYTPIDKLNSFAGRPWPLAAAYLCYTVAITLREPNYPMQVAGVCLTLMLLYLLGTKITELGGVRSRIILLGKYSLFGYIVQIAILRLLYSSLRSINLDKGSLALSFAAALTLTVFAVILLDKARSRSRTVDLMYRCVLA